jgi:hypothetical protein
VERELPHDVHRQQGADRSDGEVVSQTDPVNQWKLTYVSDKSFWDRGQYPSFYTDEAGDTARLENPWFGSENKAAPFDQRMSTLV